MKHGEGGGGSRAFGPRLAASRRTTSGSGSPRSAAKSVSSGTYPCSLRRDRSSRHRRSSA
jgi:hypothetical protein